MSDNDAFEACKYKGKWAVYDRKSCTYSYIGKGRAFCEWMARDLNKSCRLSHEERMMYLLNE